MFLNVTILTLHLIVRINKILLLFVLFFCKEARVIQKRKVTCSIESYKSVGAFDIPEPVQVTQCRNRWTTSRQCNAAMNIDNIDKTCTYKI